jgi:hypothetical protein
MLSWNHSGFQPYIGDRFYPSDKTGLGNLARYIVRACFSQERMVYIPAKKSNDGIKCQNINDTSSNLDKILGVDFYSPGFSGFKSHSDY